MLCRSAHRMFKGGVAQAKLQAPIRKTAASANKYVHGLDVSRTARENHTLGNLVWMQMDGLDRAPDFGWDDHEIVSYEILDWDLDHIPLGCRWAVNVGEVNMGIAIEDGKKLFLRHGGVFLAPEIKRGHCRYLRNRSVAQAIECGSAHPAHREYAVGVLNLFVNGAEDRGVMTTKDWLGRLNGVEPE